MHVADFISDIDNLAEPFWNIDGSKTAPKYNLTQFSLHYLISTIHLLSGPAEELFKYYSYLSPNVCFNFFLIALKAIF